MESNGIAINDLYAFAKKRLKRIQQPANVHFNSNGLHQLGREGAKHIRKSIEKERDATRGIVGAVRSYARTSITVGIIAGSASAQARPPKLVPVVEFGVWGGPVRSVASSRDGKWMANGGADGEVVLWDVGKRRAVRRFTPTQQERRMGPAIAIADDPVFTLEFSPGGRRRAGITSEMFVLNLPTGTFEKRPTSSQTALAFAPMDIWPTSTANTFAEARFAADRLEEKRRDPS